MHRHGRLPPWIDVGRTLEGGVCGGQDVQYRREGIRVENIPVEKEAGLRIFVSTGTLCEKPLGV